ncbi:hypothetical protein MKZ38_002106 [Zalerion maritima]|uniref:Uncharacterized protein n=1 Tax=Zalerion maritima TaxID=339359 RepID=A0AAD5WSP8_9PEZI|nr:hypothetical protein MKZ38_002106 [Zalerion maritima]
MARGASWHPWPDAVPCAQQKYSTSPYQPKSKPAALSLVLKPSTHCRSHGVLLVHASVGLDALIAPSTTAPQKPTPLPPFSLLLSPGSTTFALRGTTIINSWKIMASPDKSASSPHGADSRILLDDQPEQPPESLLCETTTLPPICNLPPPPPQQQPQQPQSSAQTITNTPTSNQLLPRQTHKLPPPPVSLPPRWHSKADVDHSLIFNPSRRLIDPSPPRCSTPGRPYAPYDTGPPPPPARGVVEGLADRMSQQTLEAQRRAIFNSPATVPEFDLINESFQTHDPSPDFPYPLELELDTNVESLDSWPSLMVEPPRMRDVPPTPGYSCSRPSRTNNRTHPLEPLPMIEESKEKRKNRLLSMIQTETQCHVHDPLLATPTSIAMPPPSLPSVDEMDIEASDNPLELACTMLEVDDDADNDDMSWMESIVTLRRAANPGGVRKHGLRYRASHEAAIRCSNLVKSVPRMRRRKDKHRSKCHREGGSNSTGPISSIADTSSIQGPP